VLVLFHLGLDFLLVLLDLRLDGTARRCVIFGDSLLVLFRMFVFDVSGKAGLVDPITAVRATLLVGIWFAVSSLASLASLVVLATSVCPPATSCAIKAADVMTSSWVQFSAEAAKRAWFIVL